MMLTLWMAGCLKPPAPVQASQPLPVTVATVVESYDSSAVAPASAPVADAVRASVSAHHLVPSDADPATLATFDRVRSTDARAAALGSGVVLLVELAPRYSSQMSGRYRWTVDAHVHLSAPDGAGADRTTQIPVFLLYEHDREQAAAEAAVPVIEREVSDLLDDWIR